jgi:predicted dehydrogenase
MVEEDTDPAAICWYAEGMTQCLDRRSFVASTAGLIAAPWIMTRSGLAGPSTLANETIGVGVIGYGIRGRRLMNALMQRDDIHIVGVAEVAGPRLLAAMSAAEKVDGDACAGYLDYADLLAREDLDAVVVATPDHWHAQPAIDAARAGKDVYCEKPLTLTIEEGRAICDAVAATGCIFQTGSQQRTEYGGRFRQACQAIRNGRIGDVKTVWIGVGDPPMVCDLPEEEVPAGYDWNRWLGQAPQRGFNKALCPVGVHGHYPAWRAYREYGNGYFADMGAHHYDIAQWAMGTDDTGPVRISPPEASELKRDDNGVTIQRGLVLEYASGARVIHGGPNGSTFEGTEGTISVDRGRLEASDPAILNDPLGAGEIELPIHRDHLTNWIDCIRSREKPICHEEIGHRTASVCQLAVIGYELGVTLEWDPDAEQFVGDMAAWANPHRSRIAREPWGLTQMAL